MRLRNLLLLTVALGFCVGCGGGVDRKDGLRVSGTVTFDGAPLPSGRIMFRQTTGEQQAFSGEITDGAYVIQTAPGDMRVEIVASRPVPGKFDNSNGTPEPVGEMYIPAKYNAESELTALVKADGENQFPFELSAQ